MLFIDIVLLIIVMLMIGILYPVMGYRQSKKRGIVSGNSGKTGWYLTSIISSWVPAIVLVTATILNGHSFKDLGFTFDFPDERRYLFYIALALSAIYLGYNIFTILLLRFNKKERERHSKDIPAEYRFILPSNREEKVMWRLLATTAGITEELIYRGYLFFALFFLFPEISPIWVIIISSTLFSVGHLYQGKEVWKPAAAGLFLASVYYFTGTIYIVIILHIVQDLVAGELDPTIQDRFGDNPLPIVEEEDAEIATEEAEITETEQSETIGAITKVDEPELTEPEDTESDRFEARTDKIEGVD